MYQILSPKFAAGLCVDAKGDVWKAAPIIRWMEEKPLHFVQNYCKSKGWKLVYVS